MISFIENDNILYNAQTYGFQKLHSTEHAILDIINAMESNMNNRTFSCGIFIDFKKAFNHFIIINPVLIRFYPRK